jgi:transposase
MALGRRDGQEQPLWVATTELRTAGHPFYEQLNRLLEEAGFDRYVEDGCRPYYAEAVGRPSIPPGVYFRMLFVGYFEGIDSQRGIAWRCADSLSLRTFLGVGLEGKVPDHSSLTVIRGRLPLEVHDAVFVFVLGMIERAGLLEGRTVAVDSSPLEANAAMKTIVRRDTGETWKQYIRRLAAEESGIEAASDEQARRFDRRRKKRVSNDEWASKSDPEARITKMKDGRTRLAYKAEHVVDLESDVVLVAEVYSADESDGDTLIESVVEADTKLAEAGSEEEIEEVVADKGFHKAQALAECEAEGLRTYIPEQQRERRRWTDKPAEWKHAVYANRRRVRGERSRALQRRRSELVERSFAHSCNTGAARRTWLRGVENVRKRYRIHVAGLNLGRLMRACCGVGTPRALQGLAAATLAALILVLLSLVRLHQAVRPGSSRVHDLIRDHRLQGIGTPALRFSTGC